MRNLSNGNQIRSVSETNGSSWYPKGSILPIMNPATLFLDIDDVLMLWGDVTHKYVAQESSGFDDWRKTKAKHFNRWSPSQLDLIKQTFPSIFWLTTWIKDDMANNAFTPVTDFGPFPLATSLVKDVFPFYSSDFIPIDPDPTISVPTQIFSSDIAASLRYARWWKLNLVATIIQTGGLPEGKIIWAESDINFSKNPVEDVLEFFDVRDRFYLAAPSYSWSREDIEKAGEWIND